MTRHSLLGRLARPFMLFYCRFKHPVSLPEDIAADLGITLSNFLTEDELIAQITLPRSRPTRLMRYMPRKKAEAAFHSACRSEIFHRYTIYSYYFRGGWVEFVLKFDDQDRLRRLYVNHKAIHKPEGEEIVLARPAKVAVR